MVPLCAGAGGALGACQPEALMSACRCTLHPNDSLAMEGPLSRVKSLKKSLRQSFRRIRKSRVSGKKRVPTSSPSSKVSMGTQAPLWESAVAAALLSLLASLSGQGRPELLMGKPSRISPPSAHEFCQRHKLCFGGSCQLSVTPWVLPGGKEAQCDGEGLSDLPGVKWGVSGRAGS